MSIDLDIFDDLAGFEYSEGRRRATHKIHQIGNSNGDVVTISRIIHSDGIAAPKREMIATVDLKTGLVHHRKADGTWTKPADQFSPAAATNPYIGVFNSK
tara:strand:+ start:1379 stop:1678 length:300 start_codon:yes stop_codon:yes gene_type:complete